MLESQSLTGKVIVVTGAMGILGCGMNKSAAKKSMLEGRPVKLSEID